jgi:membrane protease YdiL (CAAX protease family)
MTQSDDGCLERIFIKDDRLHPLWRSLLYAPAWLLASILGLLPALLFYAFSLFSQQADPSVVMAKLLDMANWPLSVGIGFFLGEILLLLLVTYLFVRFLDRRPFASFGFALSRGWIGESLLGLALGLGMMGIVAAAEWAFGWLTLDGLRGSTELGVTTPLFILGFLVYFILQGTGEEIPLRGYLLQSLNEWLGPIFSTLITAVGFSLLHIFNFTLVESFNPLALANIALFGVIAAYAYFVTKRLWLPSAMHAAWNFALGPIASLPVSGLAYRGLLRTTLGEGGRLFTGGDFGPEGGLLASVALLAGWGVIWLWARQRKTPQSSRQGEPS